MIYDVVCDHECIFKEYVYCTHDYHHITPNGVCKFFIDIARKRWECLKWN